MALAVLGSSAVMTACSLDTDTAPTSIVLPPTDDLSTETQESITTTPSVTGTTDEDRAQTLPDWTFERVISLAPRVDNSEFRTGSVTPTSPLQDTSGFHFSTPDRQINCSTGTNGRNTLACRWNGPDLPATRPPADAGSACDWSPEVATLSADGPTQGACTNQLSPLYRSTIVPFESAISISRFTCLSAPEGLYCIESRSDSGFALTDEGYRAIAADERAPSTLTGSVDTDESASESSGPQTGIVTTTPFR